MDNLTDTQKETINEICLSAARFIKTMKEVKSYSDLRHASNMLTNTCYSQLVLCKELEMDAVALINESMIEEFEPEYPLDKDGE